MRARDLGAGALLLAVMVAPALPAQSNPEREQLRRELKERVDRALIEAMRSLRRELHAMIDEELDGTPAWPPPGALEDVDVPPKYSDPALAACEARLARLSSVLGENDPRVVELAAELEALRAGRFPAKADLLRGVFFPPTPEEKLAACTQGFPIVEPADLYLSEASPEFRALHQLPAGVGFRVEEVEEKSPFAAAGLVVGDVLVYTAEGPIRGFPDLEKAVLALPAGRDLRIQVISERDGRRRFVSLPTCGAGQPSGVPAIPEIPEFQDPKALIDEMLQRAIRQVIPAEGGMIVPGPPSAPEGGAPPPEPAKRKQLGPNP